MTLHIRALTYLSDVCGEDANECVF
ncbi:MAG: hypothetical protein JJP05_02095 [cyanobacterium endosymbiont of Rhopalodia gibba]